MKTKLTSRKFWLADAAFLASFGMGVTGVMPPEWCGVIMAFSAGIYAACEAYVDGANIKSQTSHVSTVVEAKTGDRDTVQAFLAQNEKPKDAKEE